MNNPYHNTRHTHEPVSAIPVRRNAWQKLKSFLRIGKPVPASVTSHSNKASNTQTSLRSHSGGHANRAHDKKAGHHAQTETPSTHDHPMTHAASRSHQVHGSHSNHNPRIHPQAHRSSKSHLEFNKQKDVPHHQVAHLSGHPSRSTQRHRDSSPHSKAHSRTTHVHKEHQVIANHQTPPAAHLSVHSHSRTDAHAPIHAQHVAHHVVNSHSAEHWARPLAHPTHHVSSNHPVGRLSHPPAHIAPVLGHAKLPGSHRIVTKVPAAVRKVAPVHRVAAIHKAVLAKTQLRKH